MLNKIVYSMANDINKREVFFVNTENQSLEAIDIVDFLKKKKGWHRQQIRMINKMLSTAENEVSQSQNEIPAKRRVPWSDLIDNVFKEFNYLTLSDVRHKLSELGYPEAMEKKAKATVYQTLKRKVDTGILQKTETGKYHKPTEYTRSD